MSDLSDAADLLEWYVNIAIPSQETIGAHKLIDAIREADEPWRPITETPPEGCYHVWIFHKGIDHGNWKSGDYVALGSYSTIGDEFFDETHGGSPMTMWKPAHIPEAPTS